MTELIYRLVTENCNGEDVEILQCLDPYRDFNGQEVFK